VHFDITELFHNINSLSEFSAEQKQLGFSARFNKEMPPVVYGDEIRLRQIITNIISNAIKYTHQGSVLVEYDYKTLDENSGGKYYCISVSDTGIGIKEEDIPKLFNSFQQVDTRVNRNILGTGLGLAITKCFVELMNGVIEVKSEYGKGSTFAVYIPLPPGERDKIERVEKSAKRFVIAKQDVHVLVVDDTPMNLTVAKGFLERHNIRADAAESGQKALEMIQQKQYDLIFMDHMMGGLDGIETTALIRRQGGIYESAPIIALTANAVSGFKELFLNAGMNDYLTKPISSIELNNILSAWLPAEKISLLDRPAEGAQRESGGARELDLSGLAGIPGLEVEKALSRLGGEKALYKEMARLFCEESARLARDIRGFYAEQNWSGFAIKAHALKSICGSVGAAALYERALLLEKAAAAVDAGGITGVEELCADVEALAAAISAAPVMKDGGAAAKRAAGKADLDKRLGELKTACEKAAAGAAAALDRLDGLIADTGALRFSPEIDARLAEICRLASDFEYERAIELIEKLAREGA
jgi:CheY-like chemotaxis protein/anti-sigma regulatory factor (Ser/Thr protein kinase)